MHLIAAGTRGVGASRAAPICGPQCEIGCHLLNSRKCNRRNRNPGPQLGPQISSLEKYNITYTRSPLQDSRLFGPRPWKVLAATYETNGFLSNPDPGENLVMENLVMETGCRLYWVGASVKALRSRLHRLQSAGHLKSTLGGGIK